MVLKRLTRLAALATLPAMMATLVNAADATPPAALPAIVVTAATERMMTDRITATGTVKAVEEAYIQPQVDGLQIRTLNFDTGDRVKEGEVLATLSDDSLILQKGQLAASRAKAEASLAQLQAQLQDSKASAEEAERQRARTATLGKTGSISTSQVEQAEATAKSTAARLKAAEQAIAIAEAELKVVDAQIADIDLKLARTGIKAPVSGLITARNAKVGAIASASGEPLFTMIRDGQIEVVADVTESDLLKIRQGLKAEIRVAGGSEVLTGSVRLVSPTVDATTRLGAVHIAIDDDDRARAGMYASADIVLKTEKGIALPLTAVNSGHAGTTVRIVRDGVVHQVEVKTGIQENGLIEIVSGLDAGAEVVAKAGAFVRDGDHVTPVRQTATD